MEMKATEKVEMKAVMKHRIKREKKKKKKEKKKMEGFYRPPPGGIFSII